MVLAQLLPGAAPISRAVSTLPRNGATKFGGVPDERYAYTTMIDGGDVDDAIWGHPTINLSQDAIAEFKVYRNQFDAQYGKATTAVVSVVTKSGTNRMSGSGYYFGRDKNLNATNAFATSQPPFKQSRVGYSFGGPIVQNQTHFFTAYEGLFVDTAALTSLPASNPFAALENGNVREKGAQEEFRRPLRQSAERRTQHVRALRVRFLRRLRTGEARSLARRRPHLDWQRRSERLQQVAQHRRRRELDSVGYQGQYVPRPRVDPPPVRRRRLSPARASPGRRTAGGSNSRARRSFRATGSRSPTRCSSRRASTT
jgi:hypothetical protein